MMRVNTCDVRKGYKVVRCTSSNKLVSVIADGYAKHRYLPKQWVDTNPRLLKAGYGITYFNSLKNAEMFAELYMGIGEFQLWSISVRGDFNHLPYKLFPGSLMRLNSFIAAFSSAYTAVRWPDGTHMAASVRLNKKVK